MALPILLVKEKEGKSEERKKILGWISEKNYRPMQQ
jgi:hypothetical protein